MVEDKWLLVPCCGNYLTWEDKGTGQAPVALLSPHLLTWCMVTCVPASLRKLHTDTQHPQNLTVPLSGGTLSSPAHHHVCDRLPGLGVCGFTAWDCRHHRRHLHGPVEHSGSMQQPGDSCIQLPRAVALLCPKALASPSAGVLHPAGAAR